MACRRLSTGGLIEPVEVALPEPLLFLRSGVFLRISLECLFAPFGTKIDFQAIEARFGGRRGWIDGHPAHRIDEYVGFFLGFDWAPPL